MKPITFIDTEIDPKSGKVLDIDVFQDLDREFHSPQISFTLGKQVIPLVGCPTGQFILGPSRPVMTIFSL